MGYSPVTVGHYAPGANTVSIARSKVINMDEENSEGMYKYICAVCGKKRMYIENAGIQFSQPIEVSGRYICPLCDIYGNHTKGGKA